MLQNTMITVDTINGVYIITAENLVTGYTIDTVKADPSKDAYVHECLSDLHAGSTMQEVRRIFNEIDRYCAP